MDSGQLQNTFKSLCKVMFNGNITNPITYVTQISYLLFLKMLEEMDYEQREARNGNHRTLFGKFKEGDEELDFDSLRWSVLTSNPDNEAMLRTLRDTLPLLAKHPELSQGARAIFRNAAIVIPNGATLRRAVDIIAPISFLFLAHAMRSLRPGGTAGIIFPNGILFGDTGSHLTVKDRLLREFDMRAVVILPKGMFEPYTPNPTCFFIFRNTGRPTENVWFFKVDGDGSSVSKSRKFGSQYRNDFPDLLAMWPQRKTQDGRAWLVPARRIIDNNYTMTLSGLGLIEAETVEHADPEDILASVAVKEERIMTLIAEMRELLEDNHR